ncbi:hypothetical protein FI667_g2853, partial [Globisporangium splendens]
MAPSHTDNSAPCTAKSSAYFRHISSFEIGSKAATTQQIGNESNTDGHVEDPSSTDTEANKKDEEKPQQQRGFVSWAIDVKKRAQHTSAMLRDALVSRGRVFLSCASAWVPNSCKRATEPGTTPSNQPEFVRTAVWSEQQALHPNSSETPFRGSETNTRMSCCSSRSLSDPEELKRHGSGICMVKSRAPSSSSETDPFRRRCSSVDSYMSVNHETDRNNKLDDILELERDDEDPELIRESLFVRDGELYRIKNEWV